MKKSTNFWTLAAVTLLFVFSITSCNNSTEEAAETVTEPTFNLTTAKAEMVALSIEWMAFVAAGDSVGLANMYAQDAKYMMNGAPAISGRKNIQSTFSGMMKSGISRVDLIIIDVWGTENFLAEEGESSIFVGDTEVDQGKYIVLWKKEEGKWKMFRDIFNSNLPAE